MSEAPAPDPLSSLRHDLANILMTVRGYAELMLIRDGLDPAMRHYPEQIVTAIDRAAVMLDEMRQGREAVRQAREAGRFLAPTTSNTIVLPAGK
jgi:signal transduction histidine kinase